MKNPKKPITRTRTKTKTKTKTRTKTDVFPLTRKNIKALPRWMWL